MHIYEISGYTMDNGTRPLRLLSLGRLTAAFSIMVYLRTKMAVVSEA